jgi:hypothetical protein
VAKPTKTVLMIHRNNEQGKIWNLILSLRGLDVVWKPEQKNVESLLKTFRATIGDLPDLLLVDTNLDSNDKTTLEAISICHWCKEHYPKLKVILINYKVAPRFSKIGRASAIARSAVRNCFSRKYS